jgi:hypothetical protein
MTKRSLCALALLLSAAVAFGGDTKSGISISLSSDDPATRLGPRHDPRDARLAITSRDGSTSLLLTKDVVAVQLTDQVLKQVSIKDDAGLLEEIIASGVRLAIRKAIEVPIATVVDAQIRDGVLVLLNEKNQPLFREVKVNGKDVFRDFSLADAARFVSAVRAAKSGR